MTALVADIEIGGTVWQDMVRRARTVTSLSCWDLGDMALQIAPPAPHGVKTGSYEKLSRFAEETDLKLSALREYRRVSLAWPKWPDDTRVSSASYQAHRDLASHPDRFRLLKPGMLRLEARAAAGISTSGLDRDRGAPAPTVISIQAELGSLKHRIRRTYSVLAEWGPDQEQRLQMFEYASELADEAELLKEFLIGDSINQVPSTWQKEDR